MRMFTYPQIPAPTVMKEEALLTVPSFPMRPSLGYEREGSTSALYLHGLNWF